MTQLTWKKPPGFDLTNTLKAVQKIQDHFQKGMVAWIILTALTQSGKTLVSLLAAINWLRHNRCDKRYKYVFVISGYNHTDVKEQWIKAKTTLLFDQLDLSTDESIDLDTRLVILWNQSLQYVNEDPETRIDKENFTFTINKSGKRYSFQNCLFILDESHHGAAKYSVYHKFFSFLGINPNGDPEPLNRLQAKVLSISATPFSEETDLRKFMQHKVTVRYLPGPNYRGVEEFQVECRIRQSFPLGDNTDTRQLLMRWRGKIRFHLVRISKKVPHQFQQLAIEMGYNTVKYNSIKSGSNKTDMTDEVFQKMLQKAPDMPTIILLKDKVRMGSDLSCKLHLGFVFESATKSHHATIVQGLLGRMCGYKPTANDLEIFLHDIGKIDDYIRWWKTDTSPSVEGVCDRHMGPVRRTLVEGKASPEDETLPNGPNPDDYFPVVNQDDPIDRQENTAIPFQLAIPVQFPEGIDKKEPKVQCIKQALNSNSDFPAKWCEQAIKILEDPKQIRLQSNGETGKHFTHPDNRLAHVKTHKQKQDKYTLIVDQKRGLVYLDLYTWKGYQDKIDSGTVLYYIGLLDDNPCGHFYTKGSREMMEGKADTRGTECWTGSTEPPLPPLEKEPEGGISGVTPDLLEQITKSPEFLKQHLKQQIAFKPDGTCYLKTHSLRAPEGNLVLFERPYHPGKSRWSKKCLDKWLPPQLELVNFTTPTHNNGYLQRKRARKTAGWALPTISEGGGPLRIIRGGLQWKLKGT